MQSYSLEHRAAEDWETTYMSIACGATHVPPGKSCALIPSSALDLKHTDMERTWRYCISLLWLL